MANPEHLAILEQGVEVWNEWRHNNIDIIPKLNGAILKGINLSGIYLSLTNLRGANLVAADLRDGDVSEADICGANLTQANLENAYLSRANLHNVKFIRANLSQAHLAEATLTHANFRGAYLGGADFFGSNMMRANLTLANLTGADLSKVNLYQARLDAANLINTKLDEATLTESSLWETQRAGWSIKEIICKSVYWDEARAEKVLYDPGEFERLFTEKIKIRLLYKGGISSLEISTLPALIKHLEESHPNSNLRFVSIREDSGGAVVELAMEENGNHSHEQLKRFKAEIEAEAAQKVQLIRKALEEENLMLKGGIQVLERQVYAFLSKPTYYLEKGNINMGDKYNVSGQAGAVGRDAHAHDMTFNQIANHLEQSIDLAELAKQLGELRQALAAKQAESPHAAIALPEVAKAEIAAQEKNPSKVVEHLKSAGKWTLDFAKEVGKELVVEAAKQSMGMQG